MHFQMRDLKTTHHFVVRYGNYVSWYYESTVVLYLVTVGNLCATMTSKSPYPIEADFFGFCPIEFFDECEIEFFSALTTLHVFLMFLSCWLTVLNLADDLLIEVITVLEQAMLSDVAESEHPSVRSYIEKFHTRFQKVILHSTNSSIICVRSSMSSAFHRALSIAP